jgi:hypothetical protein
MAACMKAGSTASSSAGFALTAALVTEENSFLLFTTTIEA